jgi:hypothetical protein
VYLGTESTRYGGGEGQGAWQHKLPPPPPLGLMAKLQAILRPGIKTAKMPDNMVNVI